MLEGFLLLLVPPLTPRESRKEEVLKIWVFGENSFRKRRIIVRLGICRGLEQLRAWCPVDPEPIRACGDAEVFGIPMSCLRLGFV